MNPSHPTRTVRDARTAAQHWLNRGADVISFGRAFIANPDLVERLRADLPLDAPDNGYLTYRHHV